MSRHIALIPAAGVGARFGAGKPKQYVEINGKTVLRHTVNIFLNHPQIDYTAVILAPDDTVFQTASDDNPAKLGVFRVGGQTRAETVRNGLHELVSQGIAAADDNILVHDAARCCLPAAALSRLIEQAGAAEQGGILAVPVADTLKRADDANRTAVLQIVDLFRAHVVDVSPTSVVIETVGSESKVRALLESLEPYGVKEIVQSGAVAITRGPRSITDQLKEK